MGYLLAFNHLQIPYRIYLYSKSLQLEDYSIRNFKFWFWSCESIIRIVLELIYNQNKISGITSPSFETIGNKGRFN